MVWKRLSKYWCSQNPCTTRENRFWPFVQRFVSSDFQNDAYIFVSAGGQIVSDTDGVIPVHFKRNFVELGYECVFHPVNQTLREQHQQNIWDQHPQVIWNMKHTRQWLLWRSSDDSWLFCSMFAHVPKFHENSVRFLTQTIANSTRKWNRSLTSLQDIWNKLFFSNFLNTLPLSSTNCKKTRLLWVGLSQVPNTADTWESEPKEISLTLFDIIMVSNALLCELKATFRVVAWNSTKIVWRTGTCQECFRQSRIAKVAALWRHTPQNESKHKGLEPTSRQQVERIQT